MLVSTTCVCVCGFFFFVCFQHCFRYIASAFEPVHVFLEFLLSVDMSYTILFQRHSFLSDIKIDETMISNEEWINSAAMTIISPRACDSNLQLKRSFFLALSRLSHSQKKI